MKAKENTSTRLIKSVASLVSAESISFVLMIVFSILMARELGAGILGIFSFQLTLITVLRSLADLGCEISVPRDVSANPTTINQIIRTSQGIKTTMLSFMLLPVVLIAINGENSEFAVLFAWTIIQTLTATIRATLRGIGEIKLQSVIEGCSHLLLSAVLILELYYLPGLFIFYLTFAVFELLKLIVLLPIAHRKIAGFITGSLFSTTSLYDFRSIKENLPLLGIQGFTILQYRSPLILSGIVAGSAGTGYYSAAMRFLTVLRIIPGAMFNTMLPEFSSKSKYRSAPLGVIAAAAVIGIIISLVVFFSSEILIEWTFRFPEAITPLKILSFTFFFVIINQTLESFYLSGKRQGFVILNLIVSLIVTVITGLILFSYYNISGLAMAALAGEIVMTIAYFVWLGKSIN